MALMSGQVQVRDLVMGEGTPWEIIDFDPWTRSARADQEAPRTWAHGAWSGAEWIESPTFTWHVCQDARPDPLICTDEEFDTWIERQEELTAAFAPIEDGLSEIELRFRFGSREYLMFGRPRLVDPDSDWIPWVRNGGAVVTLAFKALDPRRYGAQLLTDSTGLPFFVSGLFIDGITAPLYVQGTRIGGEILLTNVGRAETPLALRIDGPVIRPRLTLTDPDGTSHTLRVQFDLQTNEFLTIDTGSRLVLLNGVTNRRVDVPGDYALLQPGTSTLRFNSADFNEIATLTASWRPAW